MRRVGRSCAFCLAVATTLVSCTSSPPVVTDTAPRTPPPVDLAAIPDPTPKVEPKSRYGNHSPYEVLGRKYHVLERAKGYKANGTASWYGTKFHGRATSSGERYDMYQLTAAHRSLPIPSYLRVTNLDNQRSTIVRVNDRGPFHGDRIIDLSYAAAVKLGFANKGTARVSLEAVGLDDTAIKPMVSAAPQPVGERIFLQAGAFSDRSGAERRRDALTALVGGRVHIYQSAQDSLYRVRVGPLPHMQEANRLQGVIDARYERPLIVMD